MSYAAELLQIGWKGMWTLEVAMVDYSVRSGMIGVVEMLLAAGANVNTADKRSRTALQAAANIGHEALVERLRKAEASHRLILENSCQEG